MIRATQDTAENVGFLILLRAFASGAVALTGTEAIATGVPAFQPPESRNAARTLMTMAIILATLFIGITFMAANFHILPIETPKVTVIAQIANHVYGDTVLFYLFQAFTALLLFLAANTSFAAFPRLAAVLAEDGFIPRQFAFRGDRLAFSTGILMLGGIAALVVVAASGSTHALIPLYAVGVFIDFTISQSGMVRHWLSTREQGWRYRLAINATGAVLTAVIAVVVTSVKFTSGAWAVVILIPTLVGIMLFIRRQYAGQAVDLDVRDDLVFERPHREQRVVIPVNGINRSVVQAVMFGKSLVSDPSMLQAVFVTTDLEEAERLRERWERQLPGRAAGGRRVSLPGARRTDGHLPRRAGAGVATRYGCAHDHRRAAGVRGPPLVGPAPVQPDGEAPQGDPRRARAHRDRRRPLPPKRGPSRRGAGRSPGPRSPDDRCPVVS